MKKRLIALSCLVLALRLSAQLPAGSIAPDFTAQDITGQTWHLYDLLAQDKIVVLEISATWCPPCWSYHNGHALQDLYAAHGPAGDDRLRVLFVEGDPDTETACLYGPDDCSEYTPGDWVADTDFPILDNAAIADSFQITYYPTLFVICPNKKVYEVNLLNASGLWDKTQVCPVAFGTNNAGLFNYATGTPYHEICTTLDVAPNFALINLGANLLTSADIELRWNDSLVQTVQWTGSLPLYGEAPVTFNPIPLETIGTLTTTLSQVNAAPADDDPANNVRNNEFTLAPQFATQQILLKIRTDQYGAETYWELRNDAGDVLDHGGNQAVGPTGGGQFPGSIGGGPGAYANSTTINEILNLPGPGCYSLHFVDAYGDGMCCGFGNGYYRLYNYSNPNLQLMTGGVFGAYDHRALGSGNPSVGLDDASAAGISVALFPNPVTDLLTLDLFLPDGKANVSGRIVNTLGQPVYRLTGPVLQGENHWSVDVNNWPSGAYVLYLQIDDHALSQLFFKQ